MLDMHWDFTFLGKRYDLRFEVLKPTKPNTHLDIRVWASLGRKYVFYHPHRIMAAFVIINEHYFL